MTPLTSYEHIFSSANKMFNFIGNQYLSVVPLALQALFFKNNVQNTTLNTAD